MAGGRVKYAFFTSHSQIVLSSEPEVILVSSGALEKTVLQRSARIG